MSDTKPSFRNPWAWVPSLYYTEGLPYVVVMTVSVIMYKRMGISNGDIALYTSWLYLPWVIKPLWSPIVDMLKTKRLWIWAMQLLIGGALAGVALTIPVSSFFQYTLAFFWLMAFSSATHDIAADGFYMLGLDQSKQAFFVGIRSTFYRLAMITGQGLIVILAGFLESSTGLPPVDWTVQASTSNEQVWIDPESVPTPAQGAELAVVLTTDELIMGTNGLPPARADSLLASAKAWNIDHGFYEIEKPRSNQPAEKEETSLWTEFVSIPLAGFLKRNFGPEELGASNLNQGNLTWMGLRLSGPPHDGESFVVNIAAIKGDKDIALKEGSRLVFTSNNWDQPAMAVFQLDPKLKGAAVTTFRATSGNIPLAWSITCGVLAALMIVSFVYHRFVLPYPETDKAAASGNFGKEFLRTFVLFFKKKNIGVILGFLLLYRLGEAQLVKLAAPFLLDSAEAGGLALTTGEVGFIYGTVGIIALTIGGILGGVLASRFGLKYWLWWMVAAINLPNAVYIFLAYALPTSFLTISAAVAVEQFGYGFGFTAYMLYMIYIAEGTHKTAHFAIATATMALGMMIPGMFSGWLQEIIGYQHFFIWVVIATIPAFIITYFIPLDAEFGKKKSNS